MTVTYIDANVLVYAFGDATHPRRLGARTAIERRAALDHTGRHGLRPREAIHLAVAEAAHSTRFLSDDPGFDVVPDLVRVAP